MRILQFVMLIFALTAPLNAQGARDYISIEKGEWLFGALKLDVDYASGAYEDFWGVFVDSRHIVTSAKIAALGAIRKINIKILDSSVDLIICIAKASLKANDSRLALLEITHYTDDYCNQSPQKLYHRELIAAQNIFQIRPKIAKNSPFLQKNAARTIKIENGFPYFGANGAFSGISSGGKLIPRTEIRGFIAREIREFGEDFD